MKLLLSVAALAIFVCCCLTSVSARRSNSRPYSPPDAHVYKNGYWFGTQNLNCVLGWSGNSRNRRSVEVSESAPSRFTLDYTHRVIYYKGYTFEWGVPTKDFPFGYHVGWRPSEHHCRVRWERRPAGFSDCELESGLQFTYGFRDTHGDYNVLTNNCHHFANGLAKILHDNTCSYQLTASELWKHFFRRH